jgi:hypothetical protein
VTTPLAIEQILDDPEAIVIATVKPELAVAVGVYVPLTRGEPGDVEVLVIVCVPCDDIAETVALPPA